MDSDHQRVLRYIEQYWKRITFHQPKDKKIHIGLPHPFVAPNAHYFKSDQFYWDSYFIILGLVESNRTRLAKGMVDNFHYLYKKFSIIPARNRYYNLGISQPPFLTSMVKQIYHRKKNNAWLKKMALLAEEELDNHWMDKDDVEQRPVYYGLSRYADHYVTHQTAEHESGWDMTSRFQDKCLDYLSIDLNCLIYKYLTDLEQFHTILNNKKKASDYKKRAQVRKKKITQLMWNSRKEFFFDYNWRKKKQSMFWSLAGFYPLWAKLATPNQAEKMKNHLKKFEERGGMVNTLNKNLLHPYRQWDYPNGWPNQQWIVIKGLLNYGFREDAKRIAKKWVDLNTKIFLKTGKMWEKYDVVNGKIGKSGRYQTQSGFGWTNAVYLKLVKEFFSD